MKELIEFVKQNPKVLVALGGGALTLAHHFFDRVVDAMPAPSGLSTPRYRFWYEFLNQLAGNKSKVTR